MRRARRAPAPLQATGLTALAVAGGLLLSACSSTVSATPPKTSAGECRGLERAWPTTVGGLARRETTPRSPLVAAWGDPAVIARCGLTPPGPTTDECIEVSGVDWVAHRLSDGMRFTTYGREPAIEVLVPSDYRPETLLLPAFDAAAKTLKATGRTCQ